MDPDGSNINMGGWIELEALPCTTASDCSALLRRAHAPSFWPNLGLAVGKGQKWPDTAVG